MNVFIEDKLLLWFLDQNYKKKTTNQQDVQNLYLFYLTVWGKLRLSTLAALRRILKCCHHAKATPEQLCL